MDIPAGLSANCDEGDLSEILSNLIDNACKWAAQRIELFVELDTLAVAESFARGQHLVVASRTDALAPFGEQHREDGVAPVTGFDILGRRARGPKGLS